VDLEVRMAPLVEIAIVSAAVAVAVWYLGWQVLGFARRLRGSGRGSSGGAGGGCGRGADRYATVTRRRVARLEPLRRRCGEPGDGFKG
jgi:hypothetical protein